MNLSRWFGKLNRLQQTLLFKLVASGAILTVAVGLLIAYSVHAAAIANETPEARISEPEPPPAGTPDSPGASPATRDFSPGQQANNELRQQAEALANIFNDLRASRLSTQRVAAGIGLGTAIALLVVWLGVGLTYLGIGLIGLVTAWPMIASGSVFWRSAGTLVAGGLALAASFSALIQGLRVALSGSHPVIAVARNLVNEAVRMKISMVFIVVMIFGMASLPGLLDETTPLRYRVQTFLQYSTSGAFTITALLVLFLSAASVAFEQRDKVIWQTMTKPVNAWHYVLGKWIGVSGVSAALLGVCAGGIFLFTEYLRNQPAQGEEAPFVATGGMGVSEDRMILEYQVLVGRVAVRPRVPQSTDESVEREFQDRMRKAQKEYDEDITKNAPKPNPDAIRYEVLKAQLGDMLTIDPGKWQLYVFEGLDRARELGKPITLRYKVNTAANMPTDLYRVTFNILGAQPFVREVHLGQMIAMPISAAAIEQNGQLRLEIANGDFPRRQANKEAIAFPPDGLEISYPVTTFRQNFLAVAVILWLKLVFLAAVSIFTATFLSFPVACLVSFGIFLMAEGATFLANALENFRTREQDGSYIWWAVVAETISQPIAGAFRFYSDLQPTTNLVEGKLVPWSTVGSAGALLGLLTVLMLIVATVIFRRRELAVYSGQ